MTFKKKVENSIKINEGLKEKKRVIKSKKRRIIGLIFTLLVIGYLLITNLIKFRDVDKNTFFDNNITSDELILYISFIAVILKILFSIINAFIKKTFFLLNHYEMYKTIDILSNIVLFVILLINIYNYVTITDFLNIVKSNSNIKEIIEEVYNTDHMKFILLIATIVINIPVLIRMIIYFARYTFVILGAALCIELTPFTLYQYITSNSGFFYEFEDYDDDYFIVRLRKVDIPRYTSKEAYKRFVFILLLSLFVYLVYCMVMFSFTIDYFNQTLMYIIGIIPVCYVINIFYLAKVLERHDIDKNKKPIYYKDAEHTILDKSRDNDKYNYKHNNVDFGNEKEYKYSDDEYKFSDEDEE